MRKREEKGREGATSRLRKEEEELAGFFVFASKKAQQPGSDGTLITKYSSNTMSHIP